LFGVFTNTDPSECCSLEGNFETVFHALNTHKMLPHLLSHHPYTRPIRKAMESIAEKWAIRNFRSGRELLDKLYDHSCWFRVNLKSSRLERILNAYGEKSGTPTTIQYLSPLPANQPNRICAYQLKSHGLTAAFKRLTRTVQ